MPRLAFRMSRLLVGLCGTKTETLAVARDFTFFTGTSNGSETFCTVFLYKLFIFPNYFRICGVQRYGECSDYYRLSYLRHILFLMHSLLVILQ